jgi:hypothetical protein
MKILFFEEVYKDVTDIYIYIYIHTHTHTHTHIHTWAWGSVVVKALRYLSEGPRIDPRSLRWGFFSEASDKSMCPGSTQPFEMSTRIFLGKDGRWVGLTTLPS